MLLFFIVVFSLGSLLFFYRKKVGKNTLYFCALLMFSVFLLRFGRYFIALSIFLSPVLFKVVMFLLRNVGFMRIFLPLFNAKAQASSGISKEMSKKEAYEILGISSNASKKQIKDRYKELIKKNHPDLGGSKKIADLLIKAKNRLL